MQDIRRFHQKFYDNKSKIEQDYYLLKHCVTTAPIRTTKSRKKNVSTTYHIPKLYGKTYKVVKVCQKSILEVLKISRFRLQRICRNFQTASMIPKENRGGKRFSQKHEDRTEQVIKFISDLQTLQSHYCRNSNINKQYLPSELSIKILWKQFNSENVSYLVKYDFFRKIFVNRFNLSFASPSTDVCSKCLCLKEVIKNSVDVVEKRRAMTELYVHKQRAKTFYEELRKENDHEIAFSFDCQKNMVLPKLPDQSTYFSRQLYQYNFTICKGSSKSNQSWQNVFCFTWNKAKRPKGSNEIASAVYHQLNLTQFDESVTSVKLFCDGCGGQNKNRSMISMVTKWLNNAPVQITQVTIFFPVPGHSFIPPDRVFGRIEKIVKKKETIVQPEEYIDIFKDHGTVFNLEDLLVYDWKSTAQQVFKPLNNWHFKFAPCKQFIFQRKSENNIYIQGEASYRVELGNPKSIFKRFRNASNIVPMEVPLEAKVKKAKFDDVDKLLSKHFGLDWRNCQSLKYYKDVIDNCDASETPNVLDEDDEILSNVMEQDAMHI